MPILSRSVLAEGVESADADEGFHFFGERLDAEEEIGERSKGAASAFAEDGVGGAASEAFKLEERDADLGRGLKIEN